MDAALDSHFDLDSMYTYSPASKCSSALPHQPSRPPRHDQYEISGLTRLFHTDSASQKQEVRKKMECKIVMSSKSFCFKTFLPHDLYE